MVVMPESPDDVDRLTRAVIRALRDDNEAWIAMGES